MSAKKISIWIGVGLIGLGLGCRKNAVDPGAFKSAIDASYSAQPACLWSSSIKFPVQADPTNQNQSQGYDALTDAGMLTRTPAEKSRFLIGSKQVNDYDLSSKGRSMWTADPTQPGYGNFCFGHREVTSIDSYSPANDPNATQYSVAFHDAVSPLPDWANTTEMKTAFPKIASLSSGQDTGTATLVKSSSGWQVTHVTPASGGGNLVQ